MAIIKDHTRTHIISENLEAHIEEHSYSANNHATDSYAITDSRSYCVSVVFTVNTIQLITEYLLNNPNTKLGIN